MGLRQRKKRQTRQAIQDCASRLFERHGYEHVTVAEIADAANVSVKTLFTYFGSKEDLAVGDEHELLDELIAAIEQRPARAPALRAAATALMRMVLASHAAGERDRLDGYPQAYGYSSARAHHVDQAGGGRSWRAGPSSDRQALTTLER